MPPATLELSGTQQWSSLCWVEKDVAGDLGFVARGVIY